MKYEVYQALTYPDNFEDDGLVGHLKPLKCLIKIRK